MASAGRNAAGCEGEAAEGMRALTRSTGFHSLDRLSFAVAGFACDAGPFVWCARVKSVAIRGKLSGEPRKNLRESA
jgi:hypothetical protein